MLLRPGGLLYLGVPVGRQGLAGQGQRFYDTARYARLTRGWHTLAAHSVKPECICGSRAHHTVQNGAPFCCRNISHRDKLTTWKGDEFWETLDSVGHDHWTNQPLFVLRRTSASVRAALLTVENRTENAA